MTDVLDQLEELLGMKPEPKPPPEGATIEQIIYNWKHNQRVKEGKRV